MKLSRSAIEKKVSLSLGGLRSQMDRLVADGRSEDAFESTWSALISALTESSANAYGKKSEKVDPDQLALLLEHANEDTDDAELEELLVDPEVDEKPKKPKRHRHGRGKLPDTLPKDEVVLEVPADQRNCPDCGNQRQLIGYDTSEMLEFVPAHFKKIEFKREKLACGECRATGVVTAPEADKPFERSMAGPGLLAHLIVSKHSDHMPLTRMQRVFARDGVNIAVSTMSGWLARTAPLFTVLLERMWERILDSHVTQTDATGLKVLDRAQPDNVALGTMWCHVGDYRLVVFRYAPNGTGACGPWKWLAGVEGYVQHDGANIFDRLHNGKVANSTEVGCWFHSRRRFFKLVEKEPDAARAIRVIQKLYAIEKRAANDGLDHVAIKALRQREAVPILRAFRQWIVRKKKRHPPASAMGQALSYALNHWKALVRYTEDGRLKPDNNICEGQIRDVALGRKNFLFAGSHAGAERVAMYYSLTRSCALNGVNPYEYLRDVIVKIAAGWPRARLDELLPDRWAPEQPDEQLEPDPA